ncbi:hypothetical protein [Kamptonema formosum]|nr:hypothetical protein [Oscillatoria sp. PCC 10802]
MPIDTAAAEEVTRTRRWPQTALFANLPYFFTVCYTDLRLIYKKKVETF